MEEFSMVLVGLVVLSSICGFLCAIALLILLFRIPNVSATDGGDEPDNDGESPQTQQILDTNWTVTRLLILTALHAIMIPWALILIKPLSQIFFYAYPVFEIIWYILFRKTLFAEKFRESPFFRPARIICTIALIPIALVALLMIPVILIWFFLLRHF
jgi:hypothetical protein